MERFDKGFNEKFRERSKRFAISTCRRIDELPNKGSLFHLKSQVIRSSTSVAANFRAACRARSGMEYLAKLCIVVEECDETLFWIEFISETYSIGNERRNSLHKEVLELLKVFSSLKHKLKNKP